MSPELLAQLVPLGPTVVLVAMVLYGDREKKKLAEIVSEQVEDKRVMRDERARLEEMLKDYYSMNARLLAALERVERRLK